MKSHFFVSIILLGLCVAAPAKPSPRPTDLTPSNKYHVLHEAFHVSLHTSAVPNAVRRIFTAQSHGGPFEMAEPGHPFQSTDVIVGAPLPGRRLIFVGRSQKYCLLAYERGGIAYERHIALFHFNSQGDAKLQWVADIQSNFTTLAEARQMISTNKFFETGRPGRL